MSIYIIRRLLLFLPTMLGVTVIIFALVRLVPGDIAEVLSVESSTTQDSRDRAIRQIREELGLHRPVVVQYADWIGSAITGDFGYSYWERRPVAEIISERLPVTFELTLLTLVIAMAVSVPAGVMGAVRQGTWVDYVIRMVSITGLSLPLFLTGVLMLYFMIRWFNYFPPLEFARLFSNPWDNLQQMIWPALATALYISAPIIRLTRSQMLDVVREDYVRTARSKGLEERKVIYGHALRNALLPVVTFVGWWGGRLLGGSVVMEVIFGIPGMGTRLIYSVGYRDYPVVQAIVLLMALVFLALNLAVDLLYGYLDPRIRYD